MNTKIFAGLEEIFARLFAMLIVIIGFVIVVLARETVTLDWFDSSGWLLLFWFLYELVSIILFNVFVFFAKRQISPDIAETPLKDIPSEESSSHEEPTIIN